jgi:hypothetical protein
MDDETRVPRFQYEEANRRGDRYQAKYLAAQARLDKYVMKEAVSEALAGFDPSQSDVDNLRAVIENSNLRCDGDNAICDFDAGDGKVLTVTPAEQIKMMQAQPERFGVLFDRPKPKEPSKQDLRNKEIGSMSMTQYMRQRSQPGFFDPRPDQK